MNTICTANGNTDRCHHKENIAKTHECAEFKRQTVNLIESDVIMRAIIIYVEIWWNRSSNWNLDYKN